MSHESQGDTSWEVIRTPFYPGHFLKTHYIHHQLLCTLASQFHAAAECCGNFLQSKAADLPLSLGTKDFPAFLYTYPSLLNNISENLEAQQDC